jgi:hypothetical protein
MLQVLRKNKIKNKLKAGERWFAIVGIGWPYLIACGHSMKKS